MKKNLIQLFAVIALLSVVSCGSDDEDIVPAQDKSIVGGWSSMTTVPENPFNPYDIPVHITFNADGTYTQVIIAWEQKREGTYKVEGNVVKFHMTKMEWLWDRENGYFNAYDERLKTDDGIYNSQRDATYENFAKKYPEEIDFTSTYKFDDDGNLFFEGGAVDFNKNLLFCKDKEKYVIPTRDSEFSLTGTWIGVGEVEEHLVTRWSQYLSPLEYGDVLCVDSITLEFDNKNECTYTKTVTEKATGEYKHTLILSYGTTKLEGKNISITFRSAPTPEEITHTATIVDSKHMILIERGSEILMTKTIKTKE